MAKIGQLYGQFGTHSIRFAWERCAARVHYINRCASNSGLVRYGLAVSRNRLIVGGLVIVWDQVGSVVSFPAFHLWWTSVRIPPQTGALNVDWGFSPYLCVGFPHLEFFLPHLKLNIPSCFLFILWLSCWIRNKINVCLYAQSCNLWRHETIAKHGSWFERAFRVVWVKEKCKL